MSDSLLQVQGLTCERGERILFQNLSFEAKESTLVRIAGSNGAGKTSLLRILTGLMRPQEGRVLWRGRPVGSEFWAELAYIGHKNGVKDDLSVLENLEVACRIASLDHDEQECINALSNVGLSDFLDVSAGQLSQGQRRRVALARLWLSRSKKIWILDEPFTALDVKGVARLADLLSRHVQEGGVVVLVTHQEVDVPGAAVQVVEPEDWAPRRRSRVEAALDDAQAMEDSKMQ